MMIPMLSLMSAAGAGAAAAIMLHSVVTKNRKFILWGIALVIFNVFFAIVNYNLEMNKAIEHARQIEVSK